MNRELPLSIPFVHLYQCFYLFYYTHPSWCVLVSLWICTCTHTHRHTHPSHPCCYPSGAFLTLGTHYIIQVSFQLRVILLPQLLNSWDYMHEA